MKKIRRIKDILIGNLIKVPLYQRAYSWETEFDKTHAPKQVNIFLSDLDDYDKNQLKTPYYLGHFLFEKKGNNIYNVIDGQQRLTTIIIFLSVLYYIVKAAD